MRFRFALVLVVLAVLLDGCALTPAQIRRTDALVAATEAPAPACTRADHCAIASPLLDAASRALADSTATQPHHLVALLDDGETALVARLNLIRAARRSIDVQTYIWDQDDAGQLVLDALVRAAQRGVRVRILADQLSSFDDTELRNRLARASANLEVRLYNPTFDEAHTSPLQWLGGITCCFFKFNQRMHNKLLLVDDTVGITGGRNYQDRYFDWNASFDYVDRDVLVGGPAARDMARSFELFWHHPRSRPLAHLRDVARYLLAHPQAPGWPAPHYRRPARVARAWRQAGDPDWVRAHVLADSLDVGRVDFFSDLPGKTDAPARSQAAAFTHRVMRMVADARREVVLQTPYLVLSRRARAIFKRLHRRETPPTIIVSTNSLASTDAFVVYGVYYKHRTRYLKDYGFRIYELKPHPADAAPAEQPLGTGPAGAATATAAPDPRFTSVESRGLLGSRGPGRRPAPLRSEGRRSGLHAKSIVVDDRFAMVGSHNFDPRSDHYNTEAGVIVYDPRFAAQLRASILRDTQPRNAWVVAPRQPAVPLLTDVNQAIGRVSEHLPLFDLWPYRYATDYELKPGCAPLAPEDPHFFDCYAPVGDFPDVAISPKLIYTRLMTAFGASASGIL